MTKLSHKEFWHALRVNGGIFARTARWIEDKHGVKYTRQAVKDRADKNPAELLDIREENIDIAEEVLIDIMRDKTDRRTQLTAVLNYLKTIGRTRGYSEGLDVIHYTPDKPPSWLDGKPLTPAQLNGKNHDN